MHETSQLLLFVVASVSCHFLNHLTVLLPRYSPVAFFLEIRTTFRCYEKKLDFLIVYMYSCNNNRYHILSWCPISLYAGQESWSSIFTPSSRIKTSQITSHHKTYAFTKQPPSYAGQWWRIFWLIRGRTTQGSSTEEGPHASSYTLSWYPWT